MKAYSSDDYAGLETGKYNFYYGYEETYCKRHPKRTEEECDDDGCDSREWCFTARGKGGKLLMKIPLSGLKGSNEYDMYNCLMIGLGKFINEYAKV